jgi:uncharacterized integral membrane protein
MADKRGGNKLISGVVGFAAAFGARKILIFEALTWGILLGVGVQVARMLALRATTKRVSGPEDTSE